MFTFNGFLAKLKTKFSTNKTPTSSHRFPLVLSDGSPDGNATAADIQALLGVQAIEIPSNSDLNDYKTVGLFFAQTVAIVSTISNCPTSDAFKLEITNINSNNSGSDAGRMQQRLWTNTNIPNEYRRVYRGSWGAWYKVVMEAVS